MNRLLSLLACLIFFATSSTAQNRFQVDPHVGFSIPTNETELRHWSAGPTLGVGLSFNLTPQTTDACDVNLVSRVLLVRMEHSGKSPGDLPAPLVFGFVRHARGEPSHAIEFSSGVQVFPEGSRGRVGAMLVLTGGASLLRLGRIVIEEGMHKPEWHYTYAERQTVIKPFVSPGFGAYFRMGESIRMLIDVRLSLASGGRILLVPVTTSVTL